MTSFTQNDWSQRGIIKIEIKINLNQIRLRYDTCRHSKKYKKYPSTTIVKHVIALAKENKLPDVCLLNMMPHDAYIIKIHVRTMTMSDISYKKRE